MAGADDYLRILFEQAAAEHAFLDARRPVVAPSGRASGPSPGVSLMITNRQRAELRERGFSEEAIRMMTPAQAHAELGLSEPES